MLALQEKGSPTREALYQELISIVLSSSGEVDWQSLNAKERLAVEQCVWLHCTAPRARRRIIEGGLDQVWETIRQGPLLYGLR